MKHNIQSLCIGLIMTTMFGCSSDLRDYAPDTVLAFEGKHVLRRLTKCDFPSCDVDGSGVGAFFFREGESVQFAWKTHFGGYVVSEVPLTMVRANPVKGTTIPYVEFELDSVCAGPSQLDYYLDLYGPDFLIHYGAVTHIRITFAPEDSPIDGKERAAATRAPTTIN